MRRKRLDEKAFLVRLYEVRSALVAADLPAGQSSTPTTDGTRGSEGAPGRAKVGP